MKCAWAVLLILFVVKFSSGANLTGFVYDYDLKKLDSVVVTISTVPEQVAVTEGGWYEFSVPLGNFTLNATFGLSSMIQEISIVREGSFRRDLILFPHVEEEVFENLETGGVILEDEKEDDFPFVLLFVVLAIGVALTIVLSVHLKKKKEEGKEGRVAVVEEGILRFVKERKHTTQKDIRKEFPLSEAKISLILTDLESQGKIRKVRKGRGNVIVFEKM